MKFSLDHYNILAKVFAFPEENYSAVVLGARDFLEDYHPEASALFEPFADYICRLEPSAQQELFLRSFEVQAVTTLDLGYVLFGDDYKRGELLVNLNREHREAGNDCGVELADNLSNVLRLLPRLEDEALTEELARRIVWAALRRMIRGFEPEQIELKDRFYQKKHKTLIDKPRQHYTIFADALKSLYCVLQYDFGFVETESTEHVSDFLKNIHTEANLEEDQ